MALVRQFLIYAAADLLASVITVLVSPITTRLLSPAQYGAFAFLTSAWGMAVWLQYAGMDSAYPFFRVQRSDSSWSRSIFGTATILATVSVVVFWSLVLVVLLLRPELSERTGATLREIVVYVIGLVPLGLNGWYTYTLRFMQKPGAFSRITVVGRVLGTLLALPVLMLVPPELRLLTYVGVLLTAQCAAWFLARWELWRLDVRPWDSSAFDPTLARKMLRYGLVLVPAAVAQSASLFLDRFLVGWLSGSESVAIMALAVYLGSVAMMMKGWFALLWSPHVVDWIATRDPKVYLPRIRAAAELVSVFFFSLVAFAAIWSEFVVRLLYPAFYAGVAILVPGIVFAGACSVLSLVVNATILIADRPRWMIPVNVTGLVVNVVISLVLIPRYGPLGAVIGSVCAELSILAAWIILGRFVFSNCPVRMALPLGALTLAAVFAMQFRPGMLLASSVMAERIVLTLILGGAVVLVLFMLQRRTIRRLRAMPENGTEPAKAH